MTTTPNDCAPDCQERADCPIVGEDGHWQCGWCSDHNAPMHHCNCWVADYNDATALWSSYGGHIWSSDDIPPEIDDNTGYTDRDFI